MGGFLRRARINLTTSAAIDREVSDGAASWGCGQRIFIPKGVIKDAAKVLVLLKDSNVFTRSSVCVRNSVCAGLGWAGTARAVMKMISCILRRDFLLSSASPGFSSPATAPSYLHSALGQHICEELTSCKASSPPV